MLIKRESAIESLKFFVAKATQVFTAICNSVGLSVCLSHILCHMVGFNSSANQNKLKLYTCTMYYLIISWLALILYTIYKYITPVNPIQHTEFSVR